MARPTLFAVSDLHIEHQENRALVDRLRAQSDGDWLILCGDVSDSPELLEWALVVCRERFAEVIWVPGNHELLAGRDDPLRGDRRYTHPHRALPSGRGAYAGGSIPNLDRRRRTGSHRSTVPALRLQLRIQCWRRQEDALRRAYEAGVVCMTSSSCSRTRFQARRFARPHRRRPQRCASVAARGDRQHHPLRRLPRLRGRREGEPGGARHRRRAGPAAAGGPSRRRRRP